MPASEKGTVDIVALNVCRLITVRMAIAKIVQWEKTTPGWRPRLSKVYKNLLKREKVLEDSICSDMNSP